MEDAVPDTHNVTERKGITSGRINPAIMPFFSSDMAVQNGHPCGADGTGPFLSGLSLPKWRIDIRCHLLEFEP